MSTIIIENLHVKVEDKEILKGIDLTINENEIHALMGPNGNGKSTLLAAIMGNPKFVITQGSITFDGKDVLRMSVDERSKAGLFLGMQYPQEINGVNNSDFMRAAMNARREDPISLFKFIKQMETAINTLEMKADLAHRYLNEGFSGGEKKRNEIVQMMLLQPSLAMLDEIDSGLDVDALKIVATAILKLQAETKLSLLVVSHYERFYELLQPTHAHVLMDGKIVEAGGYELVQKIDTQGYEWLIKKHGIEVVNEAKKIIILDSCGAKK